MKTGINNIKNKKKPSDILEEQLKKKETEYLLIKEIYEKKDKTGEIIIPKNMDELVRTIKPKQKPQNTKDMFEKIEKERIRREESEKLKLLEKLESQVIKKKKLSPLDNSKRLIDTLSNMKTDNLDRKLQEETDFRKTVKKEKIEIISDNHILDEDEILENDFIKNTSKEKMNFFRFRVRELYDFLVSIKLLRYIEIFIEDGFEDLESILEINNEYFKEREFSDKFKSRILEKISVIKNNCPVVTEFATDTNIDNLDPLGKEKQCCWNCLKFIKETIIEEHFNEKIIKLKVFCSQKCLETYKTRIYMICFNENCNKQFEKGLGIIDEDKWYCSKECIIDFKEEESSLKDNDDFSEEESIDEYDPMNDF